MPHIHEHAEISAAVPRTHAQDRANFIDAWRLRQPRLDPNRRSYQSTNALISQDPSEHGGERVRLRIARHHFSVGDTPMLRRAKTAACIRPLGRARRSSSRSSEGDMGALDSMGRRAPSDEERSPKTRDAGSAGVGGVQFMQNGRAPSAGPRGVIRMAMMESSTHEGAKDAARRGRRKADRAHTTHCRVSWMVAVHGSTVVIPGCEGRPGVRGSTHDEGKQTERVFGQ
jgi:hypothetical protein